MSPDSFSAFTPSFGRVKGSALSRDQLKADAPSERMIVGWLSGYWYSLSYFQLQVAGVASH